MDLSQTEMCRAKQLHHVRPIEIASNYVDQILQTEDPEFSWTSMLFDDNEWISEELLLQLLQYREGDEQHNYL